MPASACFDTRQDTSYRIIVVNLRCICIETTYFHDEALGTASTGFWRGYCRTEKEQSALARARKCSFYSKVPLPDLPLPEFDDAMYTGNSTIDVRRFSLFRLVHLLGVLGISWLSYITSRIHSALFV
jgi:hypothetical protein